MAELTSGVRPPTPGVRQPTPGVRPLTPDVGPCHRRFGSSSCQFWVKLMSALVLVRSLSGRSDVRRRICRQASDRPDARRRIRRQASDLTPDVGNSDARQRKNHRNFLFPEIGHRGHFCQSNFHFKLSILLHKINVN